MADIQWSLLKLINTLELHYAMFQFLIKDLFLMISFDSLSFSAVSSMPYMDYITRINQ